MTLTYLIDDAQSTRDNAAALVAAYTAKHPNVKINVETRPGGADGDNLVKTRLATGEMSDVFSYNSGLLQALHPTDTLVDLRRRRLSPTSSTRSCRPSRRAARSLACHSAQPWAAAFCITRSSTPIWA